MGRLQMNRSDLDMGLEVKIIVKGIERNYLLANFHNPDIIMDRLCKGLDLLQGVRRVQK